MTLEQLLDRAKTAREKAYAPYSNTRRCRNLPRW